MYLIISKSIINNNCILFIYLSSLIYILCTSTIFNIYLE